MKWQETSEYRRILEQRLEVAIECERDMEYRREILYECSRDKVFWTNMFAWTFDPRESKPNLPFILMPKQIEYVHWVDELIENQEDGLAEKSRDTGLTYTTIISEYLYRWLFEEFSGKVGSRTEDLIDKKGDPDSIFWKLRYNLKRFKPWMLPEGFDIDKHSPYMMLLRPDNSNTIVGEAAGTNFGRGGRVKIAMLDEIGALPFARSAWESAGATTNTRLGISTPPETGKNSHMYHLSTGKRGNVRKFVFHYNDDLRKDAEWEKATKSKSSAEEWERERNISYEGSVDGKVYAADFKTCEFGKFPYRPDLPLYMGWDFGLDSVAMQWWQWDIKLDKWVLIDSYRNTNKYIEYYVPFVTGVVKSDGGVHYEYTSDDLAIIARHMEWRKDITHFGDPDVAKHSLIRPDGLSTRQILQKHGIYIQSKPWAGRTHADLKQIAKLFLKKVAVDEEHNEDFIYSISSARYPKRGENSQATNEVTAPIHDATSHHRSALEYFADNKPDKPSQKQLAGQDAQEPDWWKRQQKSMNGTKKAVINPMIGR